MHHFRLSSNPDLFITKAAPDYTSRFLAVGAGHGNHEYIACIEWIEKSRKLCAEFTRELIALRPHVSEEEFALAMTKKADDHAQPLPPQIGLGASERWQCSEDEIVNVSGMNIWMRKETFRDAVKQGNLIDLSSKDDLVLVRMDQQEHSPRHP